MMELPKRIPGACLLGAMQAPEGGWFGPPVQWPTDDPDASVAARFLRDYGLPDSPETVTLLHRVLDGLRQLDTGVYTETA